MNRSMKSAAAIFYVASVYDGILGIIFLAFPLSLLQFFGVPVPPHPAYIQFSAALLLVFAIMFLTIARNPRANRNLMLYGILLKISYCSVVFWYWAFGSISLVWKPFAVFDLVFLFLFLWSYREAGRESQG